MCAGIAIAVGLINQAYRILGVESFGITLSEVIREILWEKVIEILY